MTPGRDDGAVLILVAVFATVALVFVAVVVNLGDARQNRRQLTTATDAAALDVAQTVADNWNNPALTTAILDGPVSGLPDTYDCTTLAATLVRANNEGVDTDELSCEAELQPDYGVVTVQVGEFVDFEFTGAVGSAGADTGSSTSVRISPDGAGERGVLPFVLCRTHPAVQAWFGAGQPPGLPVVVQALPLVVPACGPADDDWGLVTFPSSTSGVAGVIQDLRNGAPDSVDINTDVSECTNASGLYKAKDPVTCLLDANASVWANPAVGPELDAIAASAEHFHLPVFDAVESLPASHVGYPVVGFVEARLVNHLVIPPSYQVTLELFGFTPIGPCCPISSTNHVLEICDVGTTSGARSAAFDANCRAGSP